MRAVCARLRRPRVRRTTRWCAVLTGVFLAALVASPAARGEQLAVPNGDFGQELSGTWTLLDDAGEVTLDVTRGHTAPGALSMSSTSGHFGATSAQLYPVGPGAALKLTAWVRTEGDGGETYAQLELVRDGVPVATPPPWRRVTGGTPGWVAVWHVLDVPADSAATHVRIVLRSDDNPGTAWFDDVTLKTLPRNEPIGDGAPSAPPLGVISARWGDLVGEDGAPVRFWGVNCVDELGRDYREIANIVRRIKAMGFNAIRLHLYDMRLIDIDANTPAGERTSRVFRTRGDLGDGAILDLFDYFVYRAETEGLYLYLTLDRGRAVFCPGDYDVLPSAGPEDEAAWKEAVAATNQDWANEHLYFVDERLSALHVEYARKHLDHRNAYTGVRIADDPYVALWELTNENRFPVMMLEGDFRRWPAYFQSLLQRRWNGWLALRYGNQQRLVEAWGELDDGEDLEARTVRPAPSRDETDRYPPARLADFRRFVYDLTLAHCRRLEATIREAGVVSAGTPITYDTIYEHRHVWYYPMSQGSFQAVGQYVGGSVELERETSWLGQPPVEVYNYTNATVADKPIVVYENNIYKPAADRAYYPLFIATYASARDWDGVFWYVWSDGTVPDQVDDDVYTQSGLRYAAASHTWHGVVLSTDEVLLAGLRLGGEIFLRRTVPPAEDPVMVTAGAGDLFGQSLWFGDLDVPYPPDAPLPYQRAYAMGATDFAFTSRYHYNPDQPRSSISRALISRTPAVCSPVPGLTYDFERGVIAVDRPEAKAVVGFTGGRWDHGGGVSVEAPGVPFFCHGLVSLDGQPLESAQRALLLFTTYGENQGRVLRENPDELIADAPRSAKIVAGWGWGPPATARPALSISLGGEWDVRCLDFALRELVSARTATLTLPEGAELFCAELQR